MANEPYIKRPIHIALMGGDHYARQGITALLMKVNPKVQVKISTEDYQQLNTTLATTRIDILFMSGADKYHTGYDYLHYLKRIKAEHPETVICLYSAPANSMLWVRGDIDAYMSLQDPLYHWRTNLMRLVDNRYRPKQRSTALSLTPGEWRVLKELRKGLDMRYIAEMEKLSYRRVSALKSSAIKKLGLRNKTDLLVFLTS